MTSERARTMRPCPRCLGVGIVPLAKSALAVYRVIEEAQGTPLTGAAIAPLVGLSHSQTDNRLLELLRAGLIAQLPRTALGYEWVLP